MDTSGNFYVSEAAGHRIRIIYPNMTVATFAGGGGVAGPGGTLGATLGTGTAALFNQPTGMVFTAGYLFVADSTRVTKITVPEAVVTLVASGLTAGRGLAVDASGNLYVSGACGAGAWICMLRVACLPAVVRAAPAGAAAHALSRRLERQLHQKDRHPGDVADRDGVRWQLRGFRLYGRHGNVSPIQ
jgi:hypothetical protein